MGRVENNKLRYAEWTEILAGLLRNRTASFVNPISDNFLCNRLFVLEDTCLDNLNQFALKNPLIRTASQDEGTTLI